MSVRSRSDSGQRESVEPPVSRRERAAETTAALKAAALRVFARKGYLNTKITDITAEAGRAAGSFYNHFGGKEDLLAKLIEDILASSDARIDASTEHSPDFSRREAIRWHVAGYLRVAREHQVTMTAARQAAFVSAEFAERVRQLNDEDRDHMLGHLAYVSNAGRHLPGDPRVVLIAMNAMMESLATAANLDGGGPKEREFSDEEIIETYTEMIYRGLNGSSS